LIFNEHIKRNFAHKENFYVGYDEFSFDRVENRLIKSTLLYLKNKSKDEINKRDIRRMLLIFEDITPSYNYDGDFAKCGTDRTVKDYADIILLCKVFLHKKSFTMYGGSNDATALLFPMDRLFESYIAVQMAQAASSHGWSLSKQDRGRFLFGEKEQGKFPLRPDIVLKREKEVIIIDTKWKRLYNNSKSNYGISQADMYQMYAYNTRYDNVKKVVLLYPHYEEIKVDDYITNVGDKQVIIQVRTFDLRGRIDGGQAFESCIKHDNCIF
ncbi:MAG: McrC family protein, partial [Clostridia bacterium]|nr:McrC family protein [Clostridia bacterium]